MKPSVQEPIDWLEIRRRLELARRNAEITTEADQNRVEQILRERAASMANPSSRMLPHATPGQTIEVIRFASAGEHYAFETTYVAQVLPAGAITHIPGAPNFVVGIIAVQGDVLSVIDLRSFLDLPLSKLAEPSAVIVLRGESMEFGVLAEEILGIERYSEDEIDRDLSPLVGTANTYLEGVTLARTAILNAAELLSDPRLVIENS